MDPCVETDGILLDSDLLLNQSVDLLLEEVALIHVVLLKFLEVFLKVGNVLNDLLQDIVGRFRGMVLQSCALASQELHFLLVVIEQLDGLFRVSLKTKQVW